MNDEGSMQDGSIAPNVARERILGARGLVLTRDARVRAAANAAMAAAGLDCSAADCQASALERLRAGRFALVLCDDDAVRPGVDAALAGLRGAAPDARIVHL